MAQSDFGRMIQMTPTSRPIDDYIPVLMLVGFTLLIVLQKSKDSKQKTKVP
jgi:hypothetical protein